MKVTTYRRNALRQWRMIVAVDLVQGSSEGQFKVRRLARGQFNHGAAQTPNVARGCQTSFLQRDQLGCHCNATNTVSIRAIKSIEKYFSNDNNND